MITNKYIFNFKRIINKRYSNVRNFFNLLKYSHFFINFPMHLKTSKKFSGDFYDTWSKEIVFDISNSKNWRQSINNNGKITNIRKHFNDTDFQSLEKIFKYLSSEFESIIDIGSYDGFMSKYYKSFKKIYFADITEHSNIMGYKFYKLNGKNLNNLPENTFDVIFSIDTLIRLEKKVLKNYLNNFKRILKTNGFIIIHIPNMFNSESYRKKFTMVNIRFYKQILKNNFQFYIDNNLSNTSSFLIGQKVY